MQYHCLVYFDPAKVFSGSAEANAMLAEVASHSAEMQANGRLVMFQPLNLPQEAITVRVRDGKMSTTDGPFMETKEMLGGLVLIEAKDLNEAVQIAASMPHARMGAIEVRPVIGLQQATSSVLGEAMSHAAARAALEATYRTEARRVLATLVRLLGGFEAAEEAVHDAFAAAAERWPKEGVPANPYSWLVSAGRFKTIDRWRRQARLRDALPDIDAQLTSVPDEATPQLIADDELRLILICCHPALARDARIALTLREVAGLTTEEIARAYLAPVSTIAQRIVRAKAKIRDEALPYEVPARSEWPVRLESVLQVIYLVFNEGYAATGGPDLTRADLSAEAIRLARLLTQLLDDPEALGLLAMMLLHEARRMTRVDEAGDLILLEDQNRLLWDRELIAEAQQLITNAMKLRRIGPYLLQAAIAAVHVEAASFATADWSQIVSLYDLLLLMDPSPVVALNRAVAIAMRDGPELGLRCIESVLGQGGLDDYALAHAARADMQRRLGLVAAARDSYRRALALTRLEPERRFLTRRIEHLGGEA